MLWSMFPPASISMSLKKFVASVAALPFVLNNSHLNSFTKIPHAEFKRQMHKELTKQESTTE